MLSSSACLYLPTTDGVEVGQAVRVHSAGQDRNATVLEIKGEKVLVWYVLKNGERRERWVRSQAPVKGKDATTSQKTNAAKSIRHYTRNVLTAQARLADDEAELAAAQADNGAAALAKSEARRAANTLYASHRPYTWRPKAGEAQGDRSAHLVAEVLSMLALGTGNVEEGPGGILRYDETGATMVATLEDSVRNAAANLAAMQDGLAEALAAARAAGSTEAQIEAAAAKGRVEGERDAAGQRAARQAWEARNL